MGKSIEVDYFVRPKVSLMAVKYDISPGTVSKILWHFTGGPIWNVKAKRQSNTPKPATKAYENLKSILRTRELRLGTYKEVVKVIIPEKKRFNSETRKVEVHKNVPVDIESSPICCLSDIPAPHLRYHAYRYGKFAIGFHRNSIIRAGFNPVFYTLQDTPIIRSIYEGFSSIRLADPHTIHDFAISLELQISDVENIYDGLEIDSLGDLWEIKTELDSLETSIDDVKQSLVVCHI